MDPTGPLARRFPLVARPRPGCPPLDDRISALRALAESAVTMGDQKSASAVWNQAALLASDVGLPDLARQMCHRHAATYLRARPLGAQAARCALEPLVNLARLAIRDGDSDSAFQLLTDLFDATASRRDTVIDGMTIPAANLTATADDHARVCEWLWSVLLADGTRALTSAGRWKDAHEHLRRRRGIGMRLLDGRQVAILSHCATGDASSALALLQESTLTEAWEKAVAACLTLLCLQQDGHATDTPTDAMYERYLALEPAPGLLAFRVRLGLTILDLAGAEQGATAGVAARLVKETIHAADGYAARDILEHKACAGLMSERERATLASAVHLSSLGRGVLSVHLMADLCAAVQRSENTIKESWEAAMTQQRDVGGGTSPTP
ncbi:hypothetical protein OHA25_08095 [Nonomuraea sp. NBC_00507]|uniref:hypothetical protein n=1 Tax=Nonomuraea sp. NBC_00507 TaxID=2976002 RepID=UPI002E19D16D